MAISRCPLRCQEIKTANRGGAESAKGLTWQVGQKPVQAESHSNCRKYGRNKQFKELLRFSTISRFSLEFCEFSGQLTQSE
jgi:hypothetical protein